MFTLSYKPCGDAEPTWKQRVFFACHLDDFDRYFDEITDDILASQNCAIYYIGKEAEAEYDEELFLSYLSEMRLVVIPVTTNLLTRPSRALDVVYKYASDYHIPVLTLMEENGLRKLYEQTFGKLPFLSKDNICETAMTFQAKLQRFMSYIFIEDDIYAKQQLCDIEREADDGKIEAIKKLVGMYYVGDGAERDISRSAHYQQELVSYLKTCSSEKESADSLRSLEKALSALGGLLAESDNICEAISNYDEAIEICKSLKLKERLRFNWLRLADLFLNNGQFATAHDCYLEATNTFASDVKEMDPSSLWELSEIYISIAFTCGLGDIGEALEYYLTAAKLKKYLYDKQQTPENLLRLVWVYEKMASEYYEQEDHTSAYDYAERSTALLQEWADKTNSLRIRHELVQSCQYLADMYFDDNIATEARKNYEKALTEINKIISETKSSCLSELTVIYENLANIAEVQGSLPDAYEYYRKLIGVKTQYASEIHTVSSAESLAETYYKMCTLGYPETVDRFMLENVLVLFDLLSRIDPTHISMRDKIRSMVTSKE